MPLGCVGCRYPRVPVLGSSLSPRTGESDEATSFERSYPTKCRSRGKGMSEVRPGGMRGPSESLFRPHEEVKEVGGLSAVCLPCIFDRCRYFRVFREVREPFPTVVGCVRFGSSW